MWLSGIRVIDFTNLLPGPYATLRLAELGAEVVKVEPAGGGDGARSAGPQVAGTGAIFLANNRNKQSIVLDLKTEVGHSAALRLMEDADVVLEGFRPGVMHKLGLDYDTVARIRPNVIYCSLTGYGQSGPLSKFAGHDLNYLAQSGMLAQLQPAESATSDPPLTPSIQFADLIGGIVASEAILAALVQRANTGIGAYLDVAMTDALIGMLHGHALLQEATGAEHGLEELRGTRVSYHLYQTSDFRAVSLAAIEPKFWQNFCVAVGKPQWLTHPFAPAVAGNPVFEEIKAWFQSISFAECVTLGQTVDCCLQPVWNLAEMLTSPHVKARNIVSYLVAATGEQLTQLDTHAGGHPTGGRPVPTLPPQYPKEV